MKLGIDARLNAYREGGIAEYTRRLVETLPLLDQVNEYLVLHHTGAASSLGVDGARNFRRVNTVTPCHHRLERVAFSLEVARFGLDLLHSPDFIPPRFGARRTVITVHDLNFLYYPQFQTADSRRYYGGQIRAAVQQANHILADSQATKNDLGNLLNVPAEKVTVHVLGVDPAFKPLPTQEVEAAKRRLGLPASYMLFVGTFEPRKNLAGLLEAYKTVLETLSDAPPLLLVGRKGWLYEPIFRRVVELNLEHHVKWIENVTSGDLPAVYNGAAVLILPSFYEGFGFPALEAMACGIPTVVSRRGSLPEVVGETGVLIDPERPETLVEGLRRALTDSDFRRRSSEAGLARAATFTWRRTAEIVLEVYRRTLDS